MTIDGPAGNPVFPKPSNVCGKRHSYLLPVMLDDFVSSGHEEEKGDESRG